MDMQMTLLCIGWVLCGALMTIAGMELKKILRQRKLDAIKPHLDLGYDPENPINANGARECRRGQKDEYGFIRLW